MCERLGMQCSANFTTCTLRSPAPSLGIHVRVFQGGAALEPLGSAALAQAGAGSAPGRSGLPRAGATLVEGAHGRRAWATCTGSTRILHFCATQAHGRMAAALVSLGRWEEAVRESLSTLNRYSCKGSCTCTCIAGRASLLCVAHCDQPQQCWGAGRPEPHTEGLLRVWYRRSSTTRTDCSSSRRAHPSERAWPVPPRAVAS